MDDDVASGHCLNCGAALRGQYCGQCGQRASTRLISLWELLRDAFGDLFELDSRLWRTVVPLLIRPGLLTREYLEGRRARFMPPFRSYLVLSLLFFMVAFFDPREDFALFFEEEPVSTAQESAATAGPEAQKTRAEARQAIDELVNEGVLEAATAEGILRRLGEEADAPVPPEPAATPEDDSGPAPDLPDVNRAADGNDEFDIDCDDSEFDVSAAPGWIQKRLTPARLERLCARWELEGESGFLRAILDRIPAALILLLPVMALVLKLLYPLARRYYVEHLLFIVHFHSFFFLILILMILWERLVGLVRLPEAIGHLTVIAASFYIPVYLFVAMRRVYGQGRIATFIKFSALTVAYLAGFTSLLAMTLLMAVVSL